LSGLGFSKCARLRAQAKFTHACGCTSASASLDNRVRPQARAKKIDFPYFGHNCLASRAPAGACNKIDFTYAKPTFVKYWYFMLQKSLKKIVLVLCLLPKKSLLIMI